MGRLASVYTVRGATSLIFVDRVCHFGDPCVRIPGVKG